MRLMQQLSHLTNAIACMAMHLVLYQDLHAFTVYLVEKRIMTMMVLNIGVLFTRVNLLIQKPILIH